MKTGYKVVYDTGTRMYECPDCKCRLIADHFDATVGNWGYRYCPYCGSRMDGGDEQGKSKRIDYESYSERMGKEQKKPCDDCQQFDCYGCEYAEQEKQNDQND